MSRAERFAVGSIAVGCVVLALKALAWRLTGSAAFYSDALETTVNVAASAITFYAVRVAARPPDAEHPYGHDKAEFFAAVIVGVLIVLAALSIFRVAALGFVAPRPLDLAPAGLTANGVATVLNALWSAVLAAVGRRVRSTALLADSRHLATDVVTSAAILVGVICIALTGKVRIDPALAALAGIYVLWSGVTIVSQSAGGLMDAAPDPAVVQRIREVVSAAASGAIEVHDLRTRRGGRVAFLEFHLVVPGSMSVAESHGICDRIEAALKAEMEYLVVTIHVEPEIKAKQHGVPVL